MNLNSGVMVAVSIVISIGIYFIFSDSIQIAINHFLWQIELIRHTNKKTGKISNHLERVVNAVSEKEKAKRNLRIFIFISLLLFLFFTYLLIKQGFGISGIGIAIVIAILPYIYLRSKLGVLRISGSYEGEVLIAEILNQYKMNAKNIVATIDSTVSNLGDTEPVTKRALFKLSLKLKTCRNEKELKNSLDDFIFAINTEWAKMLTNNIYNAVVDKADILAGLEDLLSECKKIAARLEKGKRNNLEATVMIKFLGPSFFIMFAYLLKNSMGFDWQDLIQYEFMTTGGLMIFIAIVVVMFANLIVVNLLGRQKYDI